MNFFDELYAGFLGRYNHNPIWDEDEIEQREIIDVEYEDISDQIESDSNTADKPASISIIQPLLITTNNTNPDNQ